jgi:iron complex transport system ATP-binding protein
MSCGYERKEVLTEINLKIEEGKIYGIIGPNGVGKSTLVKVITKIIPLFRGEIFLKNKNIKKIPYKEFAKEVAVVKEEWGRIYFKVEEYVMLSRFPYWGRFQVKESKKDIEIIHKAMKITSVFHLKDKYLSELSSGERQLVAITRAIAQETGIIILDEPVTHLDIKHKIEVLDMIKKMNKEKNVTIIMVLHDLNLASEYCDRLVLLSEGKIYKIGTPWEVLKYEIIEEVYNTIVVVKTNPLTKKPYVFLVSKLGIKSKSEKI